MSSADGIPEEILSALEHELNTPISVIVGYAELLELRSEEPTTREAAAEIKAAGERLRSTVAQLVEDARAQR